MEEPQFAGVSMSTDVSEERTTFIFMDEIYPRINQSVAGARTKIHSTNYTTH
jgi:hypothetical protein